MLAATIVLEDTVIHASADQNGWSVVAADAFRGKQANAKMTNLQFAAVLALAMGIGEEEETPEEVTVWLYKMARPCVQEMQKVDVHILP